MIKIHRFICYFAVLLIGLLSLVNRDLTPINELKYISIALEALQNNHWFAFYNHGEIYADKPPLYFWLVMMGIKWFGTEGGIIWSGLFSFIPAIVICEIMYQWSKPYLNNKYRLLPIVMICSSILFITSALILRMDILMTSLIVGSLYIFYKSYQRHNHGMSTGSLPYWMWICIAMATFTKGPVGLALPIVSIVVFLCQKRKIKQLSIYFPAKALALVFSFFALWLLAVYLEGGSSYLYELTFGQAVRRGVNASVHMKPIYYYLTRSLIMLQPWTLLLVTCLIAQIKSPKKVSELTQFFITVAATGLVMLSLVSSKLDIYFLPLIPFIIYASMLQLQDMQSTLIYKFGLYPIALVAILLPISAVFYQKELLTLLIQSTDLWILLSITGSTGVLILIYLWKEHNEYAVLSLAGGVFTLLLVTSVLIPKYNYQLGIKELALAAQAQQATTQNQIYIYKFKSGENLGVYLNQTVTKVSRPEELINLPKGSVIITKRKQDEILQTYQQVNQPVQQLKIMGKYAIVVR